MYRATAGTLKVFAFNRTTNAPVTGGAAQITCRVSLDGGARAALADTNPTEMEDGYYLFDVTAAENNGTTADFFPESATANVQVIPAEHNRYLSSPAGSAGTGARSVQITVLDGGTFANAVQSATVRVSRSGQTFAAQTNEFGLVSFSLDDATWTVSITRPGFSFIPATLVVNGNITMAYSMTPIAPTPPAPFTGLCNVQFSVIHLGMPVPNAPVVATLEEENPTVDNYLISRQVTSGVTDANGNCVLTMVQFSQFTRGGVYRIKVADPLGRTIHDRRVKIPSTATANAEDLLDAR
jgi:hypothetical protein